MSEAEPLGDWTRNVVLITGADGKGHGSGFVARRAGVVSHVVTCAHVVNDLGPTGLEANGRPAKLLYDGTSDGIDLAVLAADGLTEEVQTLTRDARVGDEVVAVGFTRVDRGRRATARPATIREATQLTYDPAKVVKKHPGWLLAIEGDQITDGFSGGPVIDARTGMVIGVLGLRGSGTADAIAISNLAAWRDAPPAVNRVKDDIEDLRRSARKSFGFSTVIIIALSAAVAVLALRQPSAASAVEPTRRDSSWFKFLATDEVTVVATSGWQLSRDEYDAGATVCIEPSGRVNVAGNEVYNFAPIWRNLIVQYAAPQSALAGFASTYPPPLLDAWNRFTPAWAGPDGVSGQKDPMFDDCLLARDQLWGSLLMVELPKVGNAFYEGQDPLRVLKKVSDSGPIEPLASATTHTMSRKARLAFIINDAVLSEVSVTPACKDVLAKEVAAAVGKARIALVADEHHQLDPTLTPLLPYLDNLGELHVRITRTACGGILKPVTDRTAVDIDAITPLPIGPVRVPTVDAGTGIPRRGSSMTFPH